MPQKIIIVTVHGITVDRNGIAAFQNDMLCIGFGQRFFQITDQIAEVALAGEGVRAILPKNGCQLAHGNACAHAIHQIGQKLLCLNAPEDQGVSIGKDLKIAEALETDVLFLFWTDRAAQMLHGAGYRLRSRRLENIVAGIQTEGVQQVFGIACDKHDIHLTPDVLKPLGQLKAGHPSHFDIQKRHIAPITAYIRLCLRRIAETTDPRLGYGLFDGVQKDFQCQALVVYSDDMHRVTLLSGYAQWLWCPVRVCCGWSACRRT